MSEYHKIQTIFKRDMSSPKKTLIDGEWTNPEFEYLAGNLWDFTEKVDGTNIRIILKDGSITFGGRTDSAQLPSPLIARLNDRFLTIAARNKMADVFSSGAVLYGEGYGAKIQKNGSQYRADQDFILFDVLVGNFWLRRDDVKDVAANIGLDVVPSIGEGTLHDAVRLAKEGIPSTFGDFESEGIVARPKTELRTRSGSRIIAKIKCRDFR
jgi:hypothetical protein